jgi:endoglycosylceramidase
MQPQRGGRQSRSGAVSAWVMTLVVLSAVAAACTTPITHASISGSGGVGSKTVGAAARASAALTARSGFIGHSGRWMTDEQGQVVILHGLNMVYKQPPYEPAAGGFGSAAAATLESDGFDVVRVGVIYSAVEPEPGIFSASYVDSIERTVAELGRNGVYSLLDFHQDQLSTSFGGEGFPSWSVDTGGLPERHYVFPLGYTESASLDAAYDNFWSDTPGPGGIGLQQFYAGAWKYVAQHFASNRWVLGYDLFNEPWPAHATDSQLGAFYSRVISGIRQADTRHLIFYEPFVTFDFGEPTDLPQFTDAGLGMSFHDYCSSDASTHPVLCAQAEQQVIRNALARSALTGSALLLSEFGATNNLDDLSRIVSDADSSQISWIEWAYCGCDDPTGTIPASIEGLVSNPKLPGSGSNVDVAKLDVLAEPYPRITSGTPTSYAFDQSSRSFTFQYITHSPDGHAFGSGACTAVVIPAADYPGGYTVSVTGASITSARDAGILTLVQSSSSVQTVSVDVQPSPGGGTARPQLASLASCE